MADVVVELEVNESGRQVACAKISTGAWEINVRAPAQDFLHLEGIRDTDWNARRSLAVGESAGAQVFWAADGDAVTVAVAHDDETWDFATVISLADVDRIVSEARELA